MPRSTPARRKDALIWGVSGVMIMAGAALYVTTRDAASAAAPDVAPRIQIPTPGSVAPQPDGPSQDDPRPRMFEARLSGLRPLEAAILRAFSPPAPVVVAAPARAAHVARAATPQACLAQAVYYEARGEPAEGQAAVAQVVLNRTRSGRHPADVCGAVFEGAAHRGCQFSFACDPRLARKALEPGAWRRAQGVAAEVMAGHGPVGLETAVNYHADYVRPRWAVQLQRTAEIGRHIFYASASVAGRALAGWTFTAPPPPASGA